MLRLMDFGGVESLAWIVMFTVPLIFAALSGLQMVSEGAIGFRGQAEDDRTVKDCCVCCACEFTARAVTVAVCVPGATGRETSNWAACTQYACMPSSAREIIVAPSSLAAWASKWIRSELSRFSASVQMETVVVEQRPMKL